MKRLLAGLLISATLVTAAPQSARATDFRNPPNAVTWKIDHGSKTINVFGRLQIYPSCDHCPDTVNLFLALKIKKIIEDFWNQGFTYKCYKLHFDVDITLAEDRFHIDDDRVGVMVDNSPVDIRSHVSNVGGDRSKWNSNNPADRVVPSNDSVNPTSWRESAARDWSTTYPHEFGHILGLHDAYEDKVDGSGNVGSVSRPGAPDDLMSTGRYILTQETIDRLVERNGIHENDLKCACVGPSTPTGYLFFGGGFSGGVRTAILADEICGYTGTVRMSYSNNMSYPGFSQVIELNLTGNVTWQPSPLGSRNQIPGSVGYLPADGHMTWEEHGSFSSAAASCTISGSGSYDIRDPQHYVFYSSLEVAIDEATGVAHYYGIGLETPDTDLGGQVTISCTPAGAPFPPQDEDLAASWLDTGSTDVLDAGGNVSGPDGRLTGTYTHDSSNQGTGIRTFTWDFQPY